jgi:dihydroflavonol-4-reductase
MILVTGATGFIGSHLVERLVAEGRSVRCLVRRSSTVRNLPLGAIELACGDLSSGEGVAEALRGVDVVIHLAGVTKARNVFDYRIGNAGATASLVGAAEGVRRLVHVSSLAAAGPSPDLNPLTEDSDPHPISHYGRSKLEGEEAVRKSALWQRAIIIRPPVVYGPRDTGVYQVIRAVARGWMVRIGRAERRFSLIYVQDLVDGLIAAADCESAGGRIFHMADPAHVSWEEFGTAAARSMGRSVRTLTVPESAAYALGTWAEWLARLRGRPSVLSRDKVTEACCPAWLCDPSRAYRELGFHASISLENGLRRTIQWYREAGWLKI